MNTAAVPTPAPQPEPGIICLRPRPTLPFLPTIAQGTALLANDALVIPDEIVHGLLHRSTKGVLAGSSKAGKTWLLLDLAVSVATGTRFLNWPTTQGRTLFVNLEIDAAFFKRRLQAVADHKGVRNLDNLDVWSLRGQSMTSETLVRALSDRARESNYSLIVLDPIYKLMVGQAENSSTGVGVLCQGIDRLMAQTGAAVVYAHHFTKGDQSRKKPMDRLSGSGVFARDADTIITLTEHADEGCFAVEAILRNLPASQPFVVEWDYPSMLLRSDLDPQELQRGNPSRQGLEVDDFVASLLEEQPLTTTEWEALAAHSGVSRATFYRAKARLLAVGEVVLDRVTSTWYRNGREVSRETRETPDTPAAPGVGSGYDLPRRIDVPEDPAPDRDPDPAPSS